VGDLGGSFRAESVEERSQRGFVTARRGPYQRAAVVVDDDGQVAVVVLVGDLIDPDPTQPREPEAAVSLLVTIPGGVLSERPGDPR